MTYRRSAVLALLCSATILAAIVLSAIAADGALAARAVSLTDARVAPTTIAVLRPGHSVTYARTEEGYNCRTDSWFTDESAYTFHGRELSAQRWNRTHDLTYWVDRHGKHVTFDGITFVNHTNYPVLVAGWCS